MTSAHILLAKGYVAYLEGLRYSGGTVERGGCLVRVFLTWLGETDIREVGEKEIAAFREHLAAKKGRATGRPLTAMTILMYLETLKSFFEYLYRHEKILKNPLEGFELVRKVPEKERKIFSEEEVARLLDCIDGSSASEQRDRALLELMYSSGLRVREAMTLECGQVKLDERVLLVKQGKGKKDRYVPFSETALVFLRKYLLNGRKKQAKRCRVRSAKRVLFLGETAKLHYTYLRRRFREYLERAGLAGLGYTLHSLRHSCATHLLAHGAGIRYVQELLGHECLNTTQVYARPTEENIKAVYRTFHPRENEYFKETGEEYLAALRTLKEELVRYRLRCKNSFPNAGKGV